MWILFHKTENWEQITFKFWAYCEWSLVTTRTIASFNIPKQKEKKKTWIKEPAQPLPSVTEDNKPTKGEIRTKWGYDDDDVFRVDWMKSYKAFFPLFLYRKSASSIQFVLDCIQKEYITADVL